MPQRGYTGGNTRPSRNFHTGLLNDDSTGANITAKVNEFKKRGKLSKRPKYDGKNGRWD